MSAATAATTTPVRANQMLRVLLASVLAIATILLLSVSPAGAIEGPGDLLPGGNGPDEPKPPIDVVPGFEIVPLAPTAAVEVSCTAEAATVTVGNKTNNFHSISVEVDGQLHETTVMGVNTQWTSTFPVAENDNALVEVLNGSKSLLAEDVRRDCLLPEPGYAVHADCGLGKAHVRLSNTGDDTANMAVQYVDAPYTLEPIAPGSHLDWALVVAPNATVDFTVRSGHDVLGAESFTFECDVPEVIPPQILPPEGEEGGEEETEDNGDDDNVDEGDDNVDEGDGDDGDHDEDEGAETGDGDDDGPAVVDPKPEPGVDPVVEPEVGGEAETADEDSNGTETDAGVDDDAETSDSAIDGETGLLETGLDDAQPQPGNDNEEDGDDDDAILAFVGDGASGDSSGSSIGRVVVIVLWALVASLAIAAALLAWSRREDQNEALAQA